MTSRTWLIALAFVTAVCSTIDAANARMPEGERLAFAKAVADYQAFVTPRCAPEVVRTYAEFNRHRDSVFVRSLIGTELIAVYRKAVRDQIARDDRIVFHCFGPPPPPMPGKTPLSFRDRTIAQEQDRLSRNAAELPRFFDGGDAAFGRMVAQRDKTLARKEL